MKIDLFCFFDLISHIPAVGGQPDQDKRFFQKIDIPFNRMMIRPGELGQFMK
jgi:hypothetical protein